jgi:hypothetical protein
VVVAPLGSGQSGRVKRFRIGGAGGSIVQHSAPLHIRQVDIGQRRATKGTKGSSGYE